MDLGMIFAVIIGILGLLILFRMISKNSKLRKYFSVGQFLLCIGLVAAIIIVCFLFIGRKIYRNGIGELFTDYAEIKAETSSGKSDNAEGASGDTLIITVSLDQIQIGNSVYAEISEVQQIIAEAVTAGKSLRVVDDYALAATYNELIDVITQMNVNRSSIEEIKQP